MVRDHVVDEEEDVGCLEYESICIDGAVPRVARKRVLAARNHKPIRWYSNDQVFAWHNTIQTIAMSVVDTKDLDKLAKLTKTDIRALHKLKTEV